MKTLIDRWNAKTPKFFQNLATVCLALSAIGAGFIAGADYLPSYTQVIAPHLLVAGVVGAVISKLTVENK